ncbi:MAG: tetratricopeptide repeat protein [Myxococcales bacterium]|nr:tetratricopeptide repeat protein [Myxococcales bacterium]
MATDDNGGNPTDLSGVTFIGGPQEGRQTYHIRRSTGKVLGPFDQDLIAQMIRGAKLTGDESVSPDRETWVDIKSVALFAAAFEGSVARPAPPLPGGTRTMAGGPFRLEDLDAPPKLGSVVTEAMPGIEEDTSFGMGTGAWDRIEDDDDEPATEFSVAQPELRDALSAVAGVRKISPEGGEVKRSLTAELPMPAGFTNFPLGEGQAPSFPSQPPSLRAGSPPSLGGGPPSLGAAPPSLGGRGGGAAAGPPSLAGLGTQQLSSAGSTLAERIGPATLEMPADALDLPVSAATFADLPASAGTDLPVSAGRGSNLPVSAGYHDLPGPAGGSDLPVSARGNLPASAGTDLPMSSRGNLPQSPASIWDLPVSTTDLPRSAAPGAQQFGTMAMSGLHGDLPRSVETADPFVGAPAPATTELPASARGAGTSVLDTMAQTDDIWAAPEGPIRASADELRASSQFGVAKAPRTEAISLGAKTAAASPLSRPQHDPFATEPIAQPNWNDHRRGASTATPEIEEGDFGEFFPSADEGGVLAPPPYEDDGPVMPAELEAPAPAPASTKRRAGRRDWGLKIGLLVVLLIVLGGAAVLLRSFADGPNVDEPDVVAAPLEARPVVIVDVPPIAALSDGGYRTYLEYIDTARTAVGDRGSVDDRAAFLVAASLMTIEHPDSSDLRPEMRRVFRGLESADGEGDAELVALARAAYLAAGASPDAPAALAATTSGRFAAFGHLLAGLYEVQRYRGVTLEAPEEAEPDDSADGSGGDGSGAPNDGSAAAADDAPATAEAAGDDAPEAVAPIEPDEEPEAPTAVAVETLARVLDPKAREEFDLAIRASENLVSAVYWRGWTALEEEDTATALANFTTATEKNPEHVAADIGVARTLRRMGRLRDADTQIQHVIDDLEAVSSTAERSDTFIVAAEISIARLQPEIAIESLLSALQAAPTNARAMEMLGEQFFRSGQFTRAIEYFGTVSGTGPHVREATLGKAIAMFGLEQYGEAREVLEGGARAYPTDGRFPYWLGMTYESEAEFELARQYYRQATQIDPLDVRPVARMALLAVREDTPAAALAFLDDAVAVHSEDAAMWNTIGEMYLQLNETNRAVSAFREALRLDQSEPDANMNLVQYYLDSDQQRRALELLGSTLDSGVESPRVRYLNARALLGQREFDRAIEELLSLQEADPDNADYLMLTGRAHFEAGNYLPARAAFVRAWEVAPTLTQAQYYIGRCDLALEAYDEAITSLTAASRRSASGEYHYELGLALEGAGQLAAALTEYETAIDGDVAWSLANPAVYTRRGALYYQRGALDGAYGDLRTTLILAPNTAEAAYLLGRVHYDRRQYPDAIRLLDSAIRIDPSLGDAYYLAGLAYLRAIPPDNATALPYLEAARERGIAETEVELLQKLAYVYRDLGRPADAANTLAAYLEANHRLRAHERLEVENEIRTLRGRR